MPNEGGAFASCAKTFEKEFEEILNVRIEGDLCPICRYRLKNEYNGNMRDFPLRRWIFPSGQGKVSVWYLPWIQQPGHIGSYRQRGHIQDRLVSGR